MHYRSPWLAIGASVLLTAGPAAGADPALGLLDELDHGMWELRLRETPGRTVRICLANGIRLIQLRHPGQNCERVVVQSGATSVTVQYTCPGHGYGRTAIRRESSRLVQVQSQGIAEGRPFEIGGEARRVGDCPNS